MLEASFRIDSHFWCWRLFSPVHQGYYFQFDTKYHILRQEILVGNVTIGYYEIIEEYQHGFGR